MSNQPELKPVSDQPTMAELALAVANRTDEQSAASANKAEVQKSALDKLKDQDKQINDAVKAVSGLQGEAKEQAIQAISAQFGDMVVDRLSTMLLDEDVRGRYLSTKKGEINDTLTKVKELQPGAEGKSQLNRLVNMAIMKGLIEGASLVPSGNPDMGSLRFPTVKNKVVGDLLRELRDEAVHFECRCLDGATRFVKSRKSPKELTRITHLFAANGWLETPLPKNDKGNVQFQKVKAPEILSNKVAKKAQELVTAMNNQPFEIVRNNKKKHKPKK